MKLVRIMPRDYDEDIIQDVALRYPNAIKTWRGTNPEGWLYTLLHNRAIEVHDKEIAIRGRTRKDNRAKCFVGLDNAITSLAIPPSHVDPLMAEIDKDQEIAAEVIEDNSCNYPNKRDLVLRAALNDWRLRDSQLRRAAKHCVKCNLCLNLYGYFLNGRVVHTDFQEYRNRLRQIFSAAEILLVAQVLEENCRRRRLRSAELFHPYFMEEVASILRRDARRLETSLPCTLENLQSIRNRLAPETQLGKILRRKKQWQCMELERLYRL